MAGNVIEHTGIVQNINELDKKITVALQRVSACSSCHVKSVCGVSESEQKTVEITGDNNSDYKVGEEVKILMNNGMGMKALLIGYFVPFLVFMATLIISSQFMDESAAGLTALGMMIPYYLLLMLFRGKMKKTFTFKIMKI
jgi:sigma-E factor negative regulatory protein RseC